MVARSLHPLHSTTARCLRTWLVVVLAVLLAVAINVSPVRAGGDGEPSSPTTEPTGTVPVAETAQAPESAASSTAVPQTTAVSVPPATTVPPAPATIPSTTTVPTTEPPATTSTTAAPITTTTAPPSERSVTTIGAPEVNPEPPVDGESPGPEDQPMAAMRGLDGLSLLGASTGDPLQLAAAPRNFAVSDRTDTEITFTWDPPIPNLGIDHYVVQWRSMTRPVWGEVAATAQPLTSLTVPWSRAESGWFSVYAVTADGAGDRSDVVLAYRLPEPVEAVRASGFDGGVLVEWWQQSFAEWPGHRYRVEHETGDGAWVTVGSTQSSQMLVTGLTNGETSRYRVVVEHDGMESAPSVIVEATPDAQWAVPPGPPVLLAVAADIDRDAGRGLGDVDVAWRTPAVGPGQLPVAGYLVEYLPLPASDGWEHSEVDAAATTHRLLLQPGEDYAIRVTAIDEDGGRGEPSGIIFVTVDAGAPTNLRVVSPGLGPIGCDNPEGGCPLSVRLEWDAPTGYDIVGYRVEFQSQWDFFSDPNGWQDAHVELITETHATVSPRPMFADYPYIQYRFRVRAVDADHVLSGVSNRQQVTPEIPATPGVPAPVVTVTGRGDHTADLAWPHVDGFTYEVYAPNWEDEFVPLDHWGVDYLPGVGATVHDLAWESGAVSHFAVVATETATGETSELSAPVGVVFRGIPTFWHLDAGPGNGAAYIGWSVDRDWSVAWVQVRIERSATDPADGATWQQVALVDDTFWVDHDVVNGTTYWYRLRTENGGSDIVGSQIGPPVVGEWSTPLAVTPSAGAGAAPPGAPTLSPAVLTWEGETPVVDLEWIASTVGLPVDYYHVYFRAANGQSEWVDVPGTWDPWESQYLSFRDAQLAPGMIGALHPNARSATVLGVPPGASIEFAVRPWALNGMFPPIEGMISNWGRLDVPMEPSSDPEPVPPGAPTDLRRADHRYIGDELASVALEWTASTAPDQGNIDYIVEYQQLPIGTATCADDGWRVFDDGFSADTHARFTTTEYPYDHCFRVRTVDGNGEVSAPSNVLVARPNVVLLAPTDLVATGGDLSVALTWTHAGQSTPIPLQRDYVIEAAAAASGPWTVAGYTTELGDPVSNRFTVTDLDVDDGVATPLASSTTYWFRVRLSHNEQPYIGQWSAVVPATTDDEAPAATVPGTPIITFAGRNDIGVYLFNWSPSLDDGGSPLTGYEVQIHTLAGELVVETEGATDSTPGTRTLSWGVLSTVFTPGEIYRFQVRTSNAIGWSEPQQWNGWMVKPPTAPRNVAATPGDGQVVVSWEPPADAGFPPGTPDARVTYWVRHRVAGGGWSTTVPTEALSRTVTGLTNGTLYEFDVRTVIRRGDLSRQGAAPVSVTATPALLPGAPTATYAMRFADGRVRLDWSPPAGDGGSPLLGYEVEVLTQQGDPMFAVPVAFAPGPRTLQWTAAESASLFTLGEIYGLRVRARNAAGWSAPSDGLTVWIAGPASAPRNLAATPGDGEVALSWDPPTDVGFPPGTPDTEVRYTVHRRTPGGEWGQWGFTTATAHTLTGLVNGTTYEFAVRASTRRGTHGWSGDMSEIVVATPTAAVLPVPDAPTLSSAAVMPLVGAGEVRLVWTAAPAPGDHPVTGYVIESRPSVGGDWSQHSVLDSPVLAHTFSATIGEAVQYRVRGVNDAGTGAPSNDLTVTALGLPSSPRDLAASRGNGNISFSWHAPESTGGAAILYYRIERRAEGDAAWTTAGITGGDVVPTLDTPVNAAREYRLIAVTSAGESTSSNAVWATIRLTPPQVTGVAGTPGNGTAVVSWDAVTVAGGAISYRVEQLGGGESGWLLVGATTNTELTVTGLANGTTPTFRVVALNGADDVAGAGSDRDGGVAGPASATIGVALPPTGQPLSTVQALSGQRSAGEATLSWRPPSSDGGSPVTGYRVDRGTSADGPWTEVATLAADVPLMVTADGTVDVQLWFRVVAINSAGDGAATSITLTLRNAPTQVTDVELEEGSVIVTWDGATANGTSPDISYHVERATHVDGPYTWLGSTHDHVFTDSGMTGMVTYWYRVYASNGDNDLINGVGNIGGIAGVPSASAMIMPHGTPWAPTITSAAVAPVAGAGEVRLVWAAPDSDGGSPLLGYVVEYQPTSMAPGQPWILHGASAATATTATISGLTIGTQYRFRVRATNAYGTGAPSASALATPAEMPLTPPGAVRYFWATPDFTTVELNWGAPLDNGGADVTNYVLSMSTESADGPWTVVSTEAFSGMSVHGFGDEQTVWFRVVAQNAIGLGAPSVLRTSTRFARPEPPMLDGPRSGVQSTDGGTADVRLSVLSFSPLPVVRFDFERRVGDGWEPLATVTDIGWDGYHMAYSASVGYAAEFGVESTIRVVASNVVGPGYPREITVLVEEAPAMGDVVAWKSGTDVHIRWQPVPGAVGYQISTLGDGGRTWYRTGTQITITDPHVGTPVEYEISAHSGINTEQRCCSLYGPVTSGWAYPADVPAAPTITSVAVAPLVASDEARVVWTAPANGGRPITDYVVEYQLASDDPAGSWTRLERPPSTATTATIGGLTPTTTYRFRVAAVNDIGTGAPSAPSEATLPATVPTAPGIIALDGDPYVPTMWLRWSAPADDGGSPITGYRIKRRTGVEQWTTIAETTELEWHPATLPLGEYYLRVVAVNAVGESEPGSAATMLTRPATPPRNVTVTPGDGEVLVQWSPPADLGIDDFVPDFMFYLVERAPSPDGPWTGLVMVLNRTSVVRPGLTNGEPYWTRVRLMVGTVKLPTYGEWSEPAGAIVGAPTEPNALGWSRGDGTAGLTWRPPATDAGSPVTGYRVERAESADGPWTQVALVGPDIPISATVDGPVDVPLWFRVAAVNAVADGMPTVIDLTLRNAPDQVIGLEATLLSGDVMLTWDPVAEPSDDAEITYYVERALAGDDIYWPIGETDELLFTDTTALGTRTYSYRVYASNGVNDAVSGVVQLQGVDGPASAPLSITPTGVPWAPTLTSAAVAPLVGPGEVRLVWTAPASDGGSPILRYVVEYQQTSAAAGDPWVLADVGSGPATTATLGGLAINVAYRFRVSAVNAYGAGSPSQALVATPGAVVPGAPQNFAAVPTATGVVLTWDAPASNGGSPVLDYVLLRGPSSTGPWEVVADPAASGFTVTGMTYPALAWFGVAARNAIEYGPAVFIESGPATVPGMPGALALDADLDALTVRVSWVAPVSDGGSPITGYELQRQWRTGGPGPQAVWVTVTVTSELEWVSVPVQSPALWTFRVRALNAMGESGWRGSYDSSSVFMARPASPPREFVAVPGDGTVALSWVAPTAWNDGGTWAAWRRYEVQRATSPDGPWVSAWGTTLANVPALTASSLSNGTPYWFRVRAVTQAAGQFTRHGEWSAPITATPATAPGVPTNLTLGLSPDVPSVRVSWVAPVDDGGLPVTGYRVEYEQQSTYSATTGWQLAGVVSGLEWAPESWPLGRHRFRVTALNAVGESAPVVTSWQILQQLASAPRNVVVLPRDRGAFVSWFAPSSSGIGGPAGPTAWVKWYAVLYQVQRASSPDGPWSGSSWFDSATSYSFNGLTNGATYWVRVRAVVGMGSSGMRGEWSDPVTVTPATAPGVPSDVQVGLLPGVPSVRLSWSAPVSDGGLPVTGYRVEYEQQSTYSTTTGWQLVGVVSGLEWAPESWPLGRHRFRVTALNAVGESAPVVTSWQILQQPASPPRNVVAWPRDGAAFVSWAPPAASGIGGPAGPTAWVKWYAVLYEVQRASSPDGPWSGSSFDSLTSYTIPGLTNGATYWVRVRAVVGMGSGGMRGEWSNPVTVTPATAPGAPTGVTAEVLVSGDVLVSWQPPASDGWAPITGYEVTLTTSSSTVTVAVPTNATSMTVRRADHNALRGQLIGVKVKAKNVVGVSAPSASTGLWWATTPSVPLNFAVVLADRTATLSWQLPVDLGFPAGTPDVLVYYLVERRVAGGSWGLAALTTNLTATSPNLAYGTAYEYRVRARPNRGSHIRYGDLSEVVAVTPGAPHAPAWLTAEAGPGRATLTWQIPDDEGLAPVTSYRVQYRALDGAWTTITTTELASYAYRVRLEIPGLTSYALYQFRVIPVSSMGAGPASNVASVRPHAPPRASGVPDLSGFPGSSCGHLCVQGAADVVVGLGFPTPAAPVMPATVIIATPGAPRAVAATADIGTVTIQWSPPADDGGSPLSAYIVQRSDDGLTWVDVADDVAPDATEFELVTDVAARYRVAAVNQHGVGEPSAAIEAVPITIPAAPSGLKLFGVPQQFTLTWSAPGASSTPIDSYVIERRRTSPVPTDWEEIATVSGTTHSYVDSLPPSDQYVIDLSRYSYRLVATNAAGVSEAATQSAVLPGKIWGPMITVQTTLLAPAIPPPAGPAPGQALVKFTLKPNASQAVLMFNVTTYAGQFRAMVYPRPTPAIAVSDPTVATALASIPYMVIVPVEFGQPPIHTVTAISLGGAGTSYPG